MSAPHPDADPTTEDLGMIGGAWGALAPFLVFLVGVSWLGLSGAPDETGFGPVLVLALGTGLLLAKDRTRYAEAAVEGMGHRVVMLLILSWILAGVLGTLLRESGLVDALVSAAAWSGVSGGGFTVAAFLICAVFSTATGTSLGTLLICTPLLYPGGVALASDPAFLIGAILAGATFGDNISPISDTTIASATTQGADIGGVVRSRMRYAVPAALAAIVVFALAGGTEGSAPGVEAASISWGGLAMLVVPVGVLALLLRGTHLVVGLFAGIGAAVLLGLGLSRFGLADLVSIDADNFIATGIVLDGMRRAFGVSIFTLLLMGMVGGLEASGLLRRFLAWLSARASDAKAAEGWIFGSISAATILTTHSGVAILAVGSVVKELGERAGVHAYRRANLLDVTVCTYPFLLPFFIPTVLAAALTAGPDVPRMSPLDAGLHNVHSWGLLVVIVLSLFVRPPTRPSPPA